MAKRTEINFQELHQPLEAVVDSVSPAVSNELQDLIPRPDRLEAYPLRLPESLLADVRTLALRMGGQRGVLQSLMRKALEIGVAELKQKAGM